MGEAMTVDVTALFLALQRDVAALRREVKSMGLRVKRCQEQMKGHQRQMESEWTDWIDVGKRLDVIEKVLEEDIEAVIGAERVDG